MATASLVCGIASIFLWVLFLPPILAIVFGHVGLAQIDRSSGAEQGRGMAIAGLILGYLTLLAGAVFLIAVAGSDSTTY
jgi:hypothetical protein